MLTLPIVAMLIAAQGIEARFDDLPDLRLGQKVRVHFIAPPPPVALAFPTRGPKLGEGRMVGTLIDYRGYELIAVRREGWIAGIGPVSEHTIDWVDITRIETARPRNALNVVSGAAGGFVAAMVTSAIAMFVARPFCDAPSGDDSSCPGYWETTGEVAILLVPAGAVIGFFSTRWKPVYRRH
jgi:hypothetical protein